MGKFFGFVYLFHFSCKVVCFSLRKLRYRVYPGRFKKFCKLLTNTAEPEKIGHVGKLEDLFFSNSGSLSQALPLLLTFCTGQEFVGACNAGAAQLS